MVVGGLGQEEEEEEDFLRDFDGDDEEDFLSDVRDSDNELTTDFPANFKEYIERELKYSQLEISSDQYPGWEGIRWVFWSQQDDNLTLSYDASRKVRLNIRNALHKLVMGPGLQDSLVQFWAPTKTKEGRTLLTAQNQPFALGQTSRRILRSLLCEYRMNNLGYNFYADAKCAEEQLGLPGRVFLQTFPETTSTVKLCSLKEYPYRDLAFRCKIEGSWAVPVFEHSSHTCVGVLEILCQYDATKIWYYIEFRRRMNEYFQEFGLRCFDGYQHCKIENGKVTTQVDSSNQPSIDASRNGQNVVTAERDIFVVSSSKEHERKTQDRKHKKGGPRIDIPKEEILKCSHMNREDAARKLRVGISTFKRICRGHGILRWTPDHHIETVQSYLPSLVENQGQIPQLNSNLPSNDQAIVGVSHIKPGFQDAHKVTIWAKYENNKIKIRLPLSSRFVELQQEVAKRLNLEAGTYHVKYKDVEDEEDDWILMACDDDLQDRMNTSRSLGKTSLAVLLELRQPITNLNPGLSGGQQTLFSPLRSQDQQSAEGELSLVPTMHTRGEVWLDAHFSYTPTIDEEETINKCMQDGSFRGEFVDGCSISNITVLEYSEMLDHYLSHCHFFGPNVVKNFKESGRLLTKILLPKTEKIFFPILRDRHWMQLVIDVKEKCFLWLDSMRCEREKKYSEDFAHFLNREFVLKVLREQNKWPIKYPENTPIQENGNDCGMYVMAFMISLAVGDKLPQFSQAQAKRMRRTICLELKKWDIIPQCPLVDYHSLYIQERTKNELSEKLHKESTAASRDEVFLVSETSRKVRGSSS